MKRFEVIWGNKYTASIGNPENLHRAREEWGDIIEKLTDEQLARGLALSKVKCEWVPTVGEFLHFSLGILPVEQAFVIVNEAILDRNINEIQNIFAKRAALKINAYDWRSSTSIAENRKWFCGVYSLIVDNELAKFSTQGI